MNNEVRSLLYLLEKLFVASIRGIIIESNYFRTGFIVDIPVVRLLCLCTYAAVLAMSAIFTLEEIFPFNDYLKSLRCTWRSSIETNFANSMKQTPPREAEYRSAFEIFPAFYGTRSLIAAFTVSHYWSLVI
jgi:hypothetical protein